MKQKITIEEDVKPEEKKAKKTTKSDKELTCPKCKEGKIIKGKTAYGCSNYKNGCKFKVDFTFMDKKLTENQIFTLINKGKTTSIKGFVENGEKISAKLIFDENFNISLDKSVNKKAKKEDKLSCPKCGKGTMLKGKSAYGCSEYKAGCKFIIPFDILKNDYNTETLTDSILSKMK